MGNNVAANKGEGGPNEWLDADRAACFTQSNAELETAAESTTRFLQPRWAVCLGGSVRATSHRRADVNRAQFTQCHMDSFGVFRFSKSRNSDCCSLPWRHCRCRCSIRFFCALLFQLQPAYFVCNGFQFWFSSTLDTHKRFFSFGSATLLRVSLGSFFFLCRLYSSCVVSVNNLCLEWSLDPSSYPFNFRFYVAHVKKKNRLLLMRMRINWFSLFYYTLPLVIVCRSLFDNALSHIHGAVLWLITSK